VVKGENWEKHLCSVEFSITQKQYFWVFLYFLSEYSVILLSQFKNKNRVIAIGFLSKKSESWEKTSMKKNKKNIKLRCKQGNLFQICCK
jgi:hypothetical protein